MRRLVYWKAKCLDDGDCYSIRARTRSKARELRTADGETRFEEPKRVVIQYKDAFDLMRQLLGEGGAE